MTTSKQEAIDLLIVCGHGTYEPETGQFHGEFNERDLYIQQAVETSELVDTFKYNMIVSSGSFTRQATPNLSEAKSFAAIWEDFDCWPGEADPDNPLYAWEEAALDSTQNIVFSLMQARLALRAQGRDIPFRRIGVQTIWRFKRDRYTLLADALGFVDRFYFHGYAHASRAQDPEAALRGEQSQMQRVKDTNDPFLLDLHWAKKRNARSASPPRRAQKLHQLQDAFPGCFAALSATNWLEDPEATHEAIRKAFQREVL